MAQTWEILAMDKRERFDTGKPEYIDRKEAEDLVYHLAVPVRASLPAPIKIKAPRYQLQPGHGSRLNLTTIPDELLLSIIDYLDLQSCFPSTERKLMEILGPWAGERLICVGTKSDNDDLPVSFLTSAEEEELNKGLEEEEFRRWYLAEEKDYVPGPSNLVDISEQRFDFTHFEAKPREVLRPLFSKNLGDDPKHSALWAAFKLPRPYNLKALAFANPDIFDCYYPQMANWILRNITAQEFVDGKKLREAFSNPSLGCGPHVGYPGFGEAVMSRIRWSPDKFKGVWAGHRFEICIEDYHNSHSNDRWKDVTSEVIDELSVLLNKPILSAEATEKQRWDAKVRARKLARPVFKKESVKKEEARRLRSFWEIGLR